MNATPDGMVGRSFKIRAELWDLAQDRAKAQGRTISDVIREALTVYAAGGPARVLADLPDGVGRQLASMPDQDREMLVRAILRWNS